MASKNILKGPFGIALALGLVLFSILYFGFDTKPKEQKALEKSRAAKLEATGIQNILNSAKAALSKEQMTMLDALNHDALGAETDSAKVAAFKSLSSGWYEAGYPIISGHYAEEVAKIDDDVDAWSMAGTTYIIGMRGAQEQDERSFARSRALKALWNVLDRDPENVSAQINMALVYVEAPDENPMQGILMLRELNEKYPDKVNVLNQLGRLAIQTNQSEKALQRLTTALKLEPANKNTICLLAMAYQQAGDKAKAAEFKEKCEN